MYKKMYLHFKFYWLLFRKKHVKFTVVFFIWIILNVSETKRRIIFRNFSIVHEIKQKKLLIFGKNDVKVCESQVFPYIRVHLENFLEYIFECITILELHFSHSYGNSGLYKTFVLKSHNEVFSSRKKYWDDLLEVQ